MKLYLVKNTNTNEAQKVYSENSAEAKRSVCRANGWETADCTVRMITY